MSSRNTVRHVFPFLILMGGLLILLVNQPAAASEPPPATVSQFDGPKLIASDLAGATVTIDAPDFVLSEKDIDGKTYQTVAIPGVPANQQPGTPELPKVSFLVAVPPFADVDLQVLQADGKPVAGRFELAPNPSPAELKEDLTPGEMEFRPDPAIFEKDIPFPGSVAVLGSEAWIRNQRIFRVDIYPLQYNPAEGRLTWYPHVQVRLDYSGDRSLAGCDPCTLGPELDSALQHTLLNYDQAAEWRIPSGSEAMRAQVQSPVNFANLGPRYEIVVDEDGIYRVTQAELQAAGMNTASVNPQTFRLVNHGQNVAISVFGEGDGNFDPGDYITFYGEKFHGDILDARYASSMTKPGNNPGDPNFAANNWFWECNTGCDLTSYFERYTDDNVYYLLEGGAPSPRMGSVNGTPGGAVVPGYYTETLRAEQSNYWWSHEFNDDETWFWDQVQVFDTEMFYTTTLSAPASGTFSSTVYAELSARNHDPLSSPDHHTQLTFNGVLIDDTYWDGNKRKSFSVNVPHSLLVDGVNTVGLTLVSDGTMQVPRIYFDFYTLTFPRDFEAINDRLTFSRSQAGTWKYQVSGFTSSSVEVYDILDPFNPKQVSNPSIGGGGGSFTASFQVTDASQSRYIAVGTGSGIKSARRIAFYNPPNFASMAPVDFVIITHADFMTSSLSLAGYRNANGISTAVIDVNDLYHEYNDGIYHPIAIKNFLAFAFINWPSPPQYAALIGNGNFNFKSDGVPGQTYFNPPPVYMPPNLAYIDPWQGETDSINLLATLVGDDVVPDMAISRILVDSDAELASIVGKITAYEGAAFSTWQENITFITDDIPDTAGNFQVLADSIISEFVDPHPNYKAIRLYQDDGDGTPNGGDFGCRAAPTNPNCIAMTKAITETINTTGTLLVNYIGHASIQFWSAQKILETSDLPTLNNATRPPVVLSMTCLDGFWHYPNRPSMAHDFLNHPNGGAVATYSATGLGVATGHDPIQRGFFASIMDDGEWILGSAAVEGKLELFLTGANFDLMHTFQLFGDPALTVANPFDVNMTPASSGQSANVGTTANYVLQVQNTGAHPDTFDLSLSGNSWTTSLSAATVGPLNPGQTTNVTVMVSVPAGAINNAQDVVQVTVTSQGNIGQADQSTLTTTAISNWIYLTPASTIGTGDPGNVVEYTMTAKNTSEFTGSYDITFSGNTWTTTLSANTIGPLASGASTTFKVFVTIPGFATAGDDDTVLVTVTSQSNPAKSETASLRTIVSGGGIYLPIIIRE